MAQQSAESTKVVKSGGLSGAKKRKLVEAVTGYLFIAPATIILTVFGLFPVLFAIYISMHRWRIKKGAFVGLKNYDKALGNHIDVLWFLGGLALFLAAWYVWSSMTKEQRPWAMALKFVAAIVLIVGAVGLVMGMGRMINSGDKRMYRAFLITIFYAVGIVPTQLGAAMILAVMLYQKIKGKDIYRMIYFLPYVAITVASAGVFSTIFSRRPESFANRFVGLLGIPPQKWVQESTGIWSLILGHFGLHPHLNVFWAGPSLALLTIMLYNLWVFVGYNSVIFLAGLGSIPSSMYEAAEIDGANRWKTFRHITLPMLSPTIYFLSIITVMGVFKAITHVLVLRTDAARGTVDTAGLYIFDQFYQATRFGYAAAIAILLFIVILSLTFVQNRIAQKAVFYG